MDDTKASIFEGLGSKCGVCGFDYSPWALHIVTKEGEARKKHKVQYDKFMHEAYKSVKEGRGNYKLMCSNCMDIKAHADAIERDRFRPTNVAFWSRDDSPEVLLPWESPWCVLQKKLGLEVFVMPNDGRVYEYDHKRLWQLAKPVAESFVEFAREKGLEEKPPSLGTTVLKPKGSEKNE